MNDTIFLHVIKPDNLPVGIVFHNIVNIDTFAQDSLKHIIITDLLNYYADKEIFSILNLIYSKLVAGGQLEIQAPDIKQLGVAIASEEIEIDDVKEILYPLKKSIHSIYDIELMLKDIGGLIINKKYINIFEYYIVIQKI